LKFLLFLVFFISCQAADTTKKAEEEIDLALKNNDTALAKKLAKQELDRLRSTVTGSTFAVILDAGLQIQALELALQKADSSKKLADEIIVSHADGKRLYNLMMKAYKLAIQNTSRGSDIALYSKELSMSSQIWLEAKFAGKTNYQAKKSLRRLQKDIAIISAIINHMDNGRVRKETEDSYKDLIE
jgi:hypothetical protein